MKFTNLFLLLACAFSTTVMAHSLSEQNTENYFASIKAKPAKLSAFLQSMPKGGDLHNHESGATYAENMIKYALNDNLCIDPATFIVSADAFCPEQDLLNNAVKDVSFYDKIIDAWSMRHFVSNKESGHDHFFATFKKFSLIANQHRGEILAEIVDRAARENESYLELMDTADKNESGRLGKQLGFNPDFSIMRENLRAHGFDQIVSHLSTALTESEVQMRTMFACGSENAKPGCNMEIRYLYQVLREQPPEMVFAQLLAGFEAANVDKRVVGINMVQPEDGKLSMRDYKLHMRMVSYLHDLYPDVHISLHAGELNSALVGAEGLKFHISDAVNVAKANRIGHGVDIINEDNMSQLLNTMADKHIMVEINLSSNAAILNIDGKQHPLPLYMNYGVPVSLSTDDEGVSRSNLTHEYLHAVNVFKFDYLTLKKFARNSLTYSFLSGKALWDDYDYRQVNSACMTDVLGSENISPACQTYIQANEKAKVQWDLEARFLKFESQY